MPGRIISMRNLRNKKSAATTNPSFVQLQRNCSRALDRYLRAAENTRAYMMEARECPLDPEQREKLLEHIRNETRAHDAYMRFRRQVWTLLADTGQRQNNLKMAA